ncbi:MAG: nucleotidyltransferase domain-containing protein [Candidatus Omnitrophica bacterium]|nr:nucleotidyltransferase domain-containing protein [Candidatus Omnitrophota bacterium]
MKFHISLLDILGSKTRVRIISFLLTHEASMSEREMASVLKVSHMSINRIVRELADINFVDFVTVGKAHLWKVNRKSYAFKMLSTLIKGTSLVRPPLEDLKETILKNLPKILIKKVVLFGSVIKRLEKVNSDIDLFISVRNKQDKNALESSIEKLSNVCLEVYGNRLASYVLTEQEVKQRKKLKIISEIENGIQLFPEMKKS